MLIELVSRIQAVVGIAVYAALFWQTRPDSDMAGRVHPLAQSVVWVAAVAVGVTHLRNPNPSVQWSAALLLAFIILLARGLGHVEPHSAPAETVEADR